MLNRKSEERPRLPHEERAPDDFYIDILTGSKERPSPKKLLVQKVLRQLIESYGFDRSDLEVDYNPAIQGQGRKRADIAIFQPGAEHTNENLQRVIVCKTQKKLDKRKRLSAPPSDRMIQEDLAHLRRLKMVQSSARGLGALYRLESSE